MEKQKLPQRSKAASKPQPSTLANGSYPHEKVRALLGLFFVVFFAAFLGGAVHSSLERKIAEHADAPGGYNFDHGASCNVMALEVRDCIVTYTPREEEGSSANWGCDAYTSSDELMSYLDEAKQDSGIKGVLLDIDSAGGSPVAGVEIAEAIQALGKPSVAWIRSGGASAAYLIASAASSIVASPFSDVGSIGVTQSYLDNVQKNSDEGLTFNTLRVGTYKDMGNPDKPLTDEERRLFERDLKIIYDGFVEMVARNRRLSVEAVRALADGSTMLGEAAQKKGLVDIVGGRQAALDALGSAIAEEARLCWPQYRD